MKKQKKPVCKSAAVTAAVISRRLRAAGYKMANTSDKYSWTEGYHVSRVGVSRSVSIGYHIPTQSNLYLNREEFRRVVKEALANVKSWLVANGYPLDPNTSGLWVLCEKE